MHLLDANIFIEAKKRYYGFDFCPAFWQQIEKSYKQERVFSIDKIREELLYGSDELSEWATQMPRDFFIDTDQDVAKQLGGINDWLTNQNYTPTAVATFIEAADYYLIGWALANNAVIVSHEVPSNSQNRIKIPNVFIGLNIPFCTTFDLLRKEQAKFVLS